MEKKLITKTFGFTQPTRDTNITGAQNLANFINNFSIEQSDIVEITSDESCAVFTLFYFAEVGSKSDTNFK